MCVKGPQQLRMHWAFQTWNPMEPGKFGIQLVTSMQHEIPIYSWYTPIVVGYYPLLTGISLYKNSIW